MPTKRRITKGRKHRITPEAMAAFRAGDWMGLHRALDLRPWQPSPLDVDKPDPPSYAKSGLWADAWPVAFDLRLKLECDLSKHEGKIFGGICPKRYDVFTNKNIGLGSLYGAQERTRTSTSFRTLAPEASASTNSTTWAGCVERRLS